MQELAVYLLAVLEYFKSRHGADVVLGCNVLQATKRTILFTASPDFNNTSSSLSFIIMPYWLLVLITLNVSLVYIQFSKRGIRQLEEFCARLSRIIFIPHSICGHARIEYSTSNSSQFGLTISTDWWQNRVISEQITLKTLPLLRRHQLWLQRHYCTSVKTPTTATNVNIENS